MQATENDMRALVPVSPQAAGLVRPLVDPRAAQLAIREYEALKSAIVQPGDVQKIQGRDFLKKSFWRRVATCFGLSLELVSEERGHDEKGGLFYSVVYRAEAPNGRTMIGDGYCSQSESGRGGWPEHNVRATAHTRAKNRAISDLVGGGEVSAEEMGDYVDAEPAQPRTAPAPRTAPKPAPKPSAKLPKPSWSMLRQRALAVGYETQEAWEQFCREVTQKDDPKAYGQDDYINVEATIASIEKRRDEQAADAEWAEVIEAAEQPAPEQYDLHELGTVRG